MRVSWIDHLPPQVMMGVILRAYGEMKAA